MCMLYITLDTVTVVLHETPGNLSKITHWI